MSPTVVLFIAMAILLLIGCPIGVALGLSILILIGYEPVVQASLVAQSMYSGLASFTMMALPFFMISGGIMSTGGLSRRIVNVANSLVGNIPGSLGIVTVLACMFFGAVSGSAPATVAAIGSMMVPEMVRAGYNKYYAAGLIAVAGALGIIVPPSYPMVIYATTNNVSIGTLFVAGLGPALVVGLILIAINCFLARKNGWGGGRKDKFSLRAVGKALWDAKLALLMPIIILGGIYGGVFTATEASVVAAIYGMFVCIFVYREFTWKQLWEEYKSNMILVGGMMFTVAPASAMGAVFSLLKIPDAVKSFFLSLSPSFYVVILAVLIVLIIAGMFLTTTPIIVILSPILLPVVAEFGMSPVQFGMIMMIALGIAFVTPPVAINLFTAASMTGLSTSKIVKRSIPFLLGMTAALLIVAYIPQISTVFPSLFGM